MFNTNVKMNLNKVLTKPKNIKNIKTLKHKKNLNLKIKEKHYILGYMCKK